jgi:hypothetical protein
MACSVPGSTSTSRRGARVTTAAGTTGLAVDALFRFGGQYVLPAKLGEKPRGESQHQNAARANASPRSKAVRGFGREVTGTSMCAIAWLCLKP